VLKVSENFTCQLPAGALRGSAFGLWAHVEAGLFFSAGAQNESLLSTWRVFRPPGSIQLKKTSHGGEIMETLKER